jgi:hypothetical protein
MCRMTSLYVCACVCFTSQVRELLVLVIIFGANFFVSEILQGRLVTLAGGASTCASAFICISPNGVSIEGNSTVNVWDTSSCVV